LGVNYERFGDVGIFGGGIAEEGGLIIGGKGLWIDGGGGIPIKVVAENGVGFGVEMVDEN
jgi:hypothetical protein